MNNRNLSNQMLNAIQNSINSFPKKYDVNLSIPKKGENFIPCVEVHQPSYINIDIDEEFDVDDLTSDGLNSRNKKRGTLSITNSKVDVTLWIDVKLMHIAVL